jgi:hypothetical protein
MTRSGDELAANSSQPCPKGENRGRMAALEAAYDGYRLSEDINPNYSPHDAKYAPQRAPTPLPRPWFSIGVSGRALALAGVVSRC